MKSLSHFGLVLGMIALLPNQLFAGEVTQWIYENNSNIAYGGMGVGTAMFVVGGVVSDSASRRMEDAQRLLKAPEERDKLAKQLGDAEREYHAEKARLEKFLKDSPASSKSSNVVSLDTVRQRKLYDQARLKYQNLQAELVTFDKRFGIEAATPANMIKAAKKDLRRSEKIFSASMISQMISIPTVFVPVITAGVVTKIEKAKKAESANEDTGQPASASSRPINPSAL